MLQPNQAVDLTNCDREAIHLPGSIQPHGCLFVCDSGGTVIRRASVNASAMLGLKTEQLNDVMLSGVFSESVTHAIRNAAARSNDPSRPALLLDITLGENPSAFDISVHTHKGAMIVEFEPSHGANMSSPLDLARTLIGRLNKIRDPDRLIADAARLVRGLLSYDRVMIYRFAHDGSGEVVSESKRGDLESFLGQHFPASDIPKQARQLYLDNTIRVIGDASADRVPVLPVLDASGEPLDMSFAHLRSVSPIHCEYLRNMGVSASMSVSIVIEKKLWGLIACHHYSPRPLPMAQRIASEMFGQFFELTLESLNYERSMTVAARARSVLDDILQRMSHHVDVVTLLQENIAAFHDLLPCDGIGVWIDGKWAASGTTPPLSAIPALAHFVNAVAVGKIWATHALTDAYPPAIDFQDVAAGVMAVPLSQLPRDYILFFRREVIQTVKWGGNPEKTYEVGPQGDRLTPRKSFAIWKQTVERQSMPWTTSDREIAEASRTALVEIVLRHNEVLAGERAKYDLRQKMLNEELNHRVKNILALIKSLVSHPVDNGRDLQGYILSLKGRIQALSFAHDQVIRGSGGGALRDLLAAELSPYRDSGATLVMDGPSVLLDSRAFSVMALVLHELATNAAKYGALSTSRGSLRVTWRMTDDQSCDIDWVETGGPAVKIPSREGFGSVLLNRSVPFDLGGTSTVSFAPAGLNAHIVLPARFITALAETEVALADHESVRRTTSNLPDGLRILLVEDQLVIALDAETMLNAKGAAEVETVSSVDEALAAIERRAPDVAILDIHLGMDTSWPVAEELDRRQIPFIVASGYGDLAAVPGAWTSAPIIRKPYDAEAIVTALRKVSSEDRKKTLA
jgi:light-regulated signal transduction histidine kinase (bacteriophytochrome)/ActR/RegA family two-component response regulator